MDPKHRTRGLGLRAFGEAQDLLHKDQRREKAETNSWKK